MSVKIKIVFGFIVILLVVFGQSYINYTINQEQDKLSSEAIALFQVNQTLKDRLIDLKNFESVFLLEIEATSSSVVIGNHPTWEYIQRLNQWHAVFSASSDYRKMDPLRKGLVDELKDHFGSIDKSYKKINTEKNKTRQREIYRGEITPTIVQVQSNITDIVSRNSMVYNLANRNMAAYSNQMIRYQILSISVSLIFVIFIIFYTQFLLQPLGWLMEGVKRITSGDMGYHVKKRSRDELGALADQFNQMSKEIGNHREHLEDLVKQRTEQLVQANAELEKTNKDLTEARKIAEIDMQMAVSVQSSILPKIPPRVPGWEVAYYFKPMVGVSGDIYDFYIDDDGTLLGAMMMDASGHGIASGLVTMIAKSVSSRVFHEEYNHRAGVILGHINRTLIDEIGGTDKYLTGILLKINESSVEYTNAGHTELIIKKENGPAKIVAQKEDSAFKGFFLGIDAMRPENDTYYSMIFNVAKGDTLFIFCDCLNETVNSKGEEFSIERIQNLISVNNFKTAQQLIDFMVEELYRFSGTRELTDDFTLIALKRTE